MTDGLPSPLSRSADEGSFVVQMIVDHLHEDQ
ncbi:MAG: hypothetical protein K0R53_570 [Burkholderiales bacterium]|nr:hypothetical protein [Burkholderiales bacterium]